MYYKSLRVFVKENISGRYRIAQILDEGFLLLLSFSSVSMIKFIIFRKLVFNYNILPSYRKDKNPAKIPQPVSV